MPAPPHPDRAGAAAAARADGETLAAAAQELAPEMPLAAYAARLRGAGELLATAREDRELARELMEMPALKRIDAALHEPRFHRPTLACLLALAAESALDDPTGNPCPVAELAAAVASCLPRDGQGKARRAAAWAYWLLGKALLGASQWRLAEGAFECMSAFIPRERGRSEEEALACCGLAQVREDTGNVEAAVALYLRGGYLFAKLGAAAPAAACQAQLGLLLHESGDLANAALPLRGALGLLDPAFAPSLAARLWLALGQVQAVLGETAAAAESLRRARALYPLAPSPEEGIARRWREAKITLAAGEDAVAEARLDRVRRELLARGSRLEAARSTFEQLLLTLDGRRFEAARELVAALAAAPRAGEPWAGAMAELVRLAVEEPGGSYQASLDLKRRLRQAPLAGGDRPPLLRSSRQLADRLLRRRGELEDPIGAAVTL